MAALGSCFASRVVFWDEAQGQAMEVQYRRILLHAIARGGEEDEAFATPCIYAQVQGMPSCSTMVVFDT